ncbi:PaaI family thioesterase [Glaciimonas sp. PAMC28666]|uniref:PaaI family thioesterase n=1 Tax=Glaciimonas sp. PAMC28666 TaxID=2807626 RepID=UPI0019651A51|nr:PaaI family thioesterase [Glaciimonas sp. PAMC28666]QRX83102.1 PaaI family thioesterase [Glaciimonas sp. PAMC28666]
MTNREETLALWKEQETGVRARLAAPGVATLAQLKERSGMEFLQDIWDGKLPSVLIGETLDFIPIEGEPGRIVFQGTPGRKHYNPLGSVHGGYFCTLLDSALGCTVHSMLPKGMGYTTLEIKVNLLRPLTEKTGPVRAIGKVIQVGKQVGVSEANIVDVDGKIYAHATTTCLIFPLP